MADFNQVQHYLKLQVGNVPQGAHPDIWMLIRYWRYIHPEGRLPGGNHFDLNDIPGLRPNIRLLSVIEGGSHRYRIDMLGTECARQLGYDPTGGWYETISSRFENSVIELDLERARHTLQPVYRKGRTIVTYASGARFIERVHVPLASDGRHVDRIASLTLFFPELRPFRGSRPTATAFPGSDGTSSARPFYRPDLGIAAAGMQFASGELPLRPL